MNTNPYKITDLEKALLRVPKSNIPELLEVIFLSREFATLSSIDKDKLISNIKSINNLDPDFAISAKDKIISALKLKIKNSDRQLARAVFQNRINQLEQSKEPILEFDRLISTKFSEKLLEEIIKYEWGNVESHYKNLNEWKYIFSKISFYNDDLPEDNFDVFRAGTKEGLSWTTEGSVAKWFYNKNLKNKQTKFNNFLKLNVSKNDVLFSLNHKNESEVVLIPRIENIESVSKDYIKSIPTINSPRNKRIAKGQL